jgi:hypothetical protein
MEEALDAANRARQRVSEMGPPARDLYMDLVLTENYDEEWEITVRPYEVIEFRGAVYGRRRLSSIERASRLDAVEIGIKEMELLLRSMENKLRYYRASGEIPRDRVGDAVRQLLIANQNLEKQKLELSLSEWKALKGRIMTGTEPTPSVKPIRSVAYDWL